MKFHLITNTSVPNPVSVIYHADCPDGFGAALAAWKHFGTTADYIPMHHGESWEELELKGRSIYILDFSFSRDTLEKIATLASNVTQIDHHASARLPWVAELASSDNSLETFQHTALPLRLHFDLKKSGARLSWEHFFPDLPVPLTLRHIEDMDMWRFALPGTRAFSRALRLLPFNFTTWEQLLAETETTESQRYQNMLSQGGAIEAFLEHEIERLMQSQLVMPATLRGEVIAPLQPVRHNQSPLQPRPLSEPGIRGLAINADSLFASELGNKLAERSGSFGLIWQLAADGEIKASLRANGNIDVAVIASQYGGGGHPNAAGFRMPAKRFIIEVLGQ